MSTFSLWRGGRLLGRFVERQPVTHHGKRVGASGVLEPTDDFVGVTSMLQACVPVIPGKPVFQHPLEPVTVGTLTERKRSSGGPKALNPLSDEEARGVPEDRVLQIRDNEGNLIDTATVLLQLFSIPEGVDAAAIHRANGLDGDSRDVWNISFSILAP